MTRLIECGICGAYHPEGFQGDCRDDANRYPTDDPRDLIREYRERFPDDRKLIESGTPEETNASLAYIRAKWGRDAYEEATERVVITVTLDPGEERPTTLHEAAQLALTCADERLTEADFEPIPERNA